MSPIVLHGPRGIVSKDIGCGNNKILHPSVTIWTKPCARAFQNSTFPMHSNSICHKTTTFPLLKSASDEAITVTENGVIEIEDEATFEQHLKEAGDKLVVLDISTRTCGPCKMIYPKLVQMSKEYPDAVFLKINGDISNDTRALMRKWGIRAVPNFRFFRNGELIHSHTGAKEAELRANFLTHYTQTPQV